jgi:pyruvate-formate lyase-activating enzyme
VNLVGGESLIHLYSPQMLRALSEYSVKTSVVTNAIVVREELKIMLDCTGRE